MARTAAGAQLTRTHRRSQLQLRARALRDWMLLWPLWTGDEQSFQQLLAASLPLVNAYHGLSATLAAAYFEMFRAAENVGGTATPRMPDPPDSEMVRGTLHLVGMDMTRNALLAGQPPQQAMRTALVRTSGTVTRFVLAGGRDTVIMSSAEDRRARGWARVTDSNPCAFCLTLASRGAVFSEDTADFRAHDACGCTAQPVYQDDALPESARWRDLYNSAQRWARDNPDLAASGTANDRLNNVRRYLAHQA